ncbi:hypothetical protein [Flavobacterium psychrotrophum]|uniref:hypothetical protein n=1 Tax=Flavobacterium psychrotrophum TaxID=2294119 RepID=UPI000E319364|nr:hypothetical protein [Flavobacterium psychrotrophum]
MKKKPIILLTLLLLAGCNNKSKTSEPTQQSDNFFDKFEKLDKTTPFFTFDQVTYYHNDFTSGEFADIIDKEDSISKSEKNLLETITTNLPENLNDIIIINIKNNYPVKIEMPEKDIQFLKDIFQEKYKDRDWSSACVPMYRDVLVFKTRGKITGIAKICFGCWEFSFSGTKAKTGGFGLKNELNNLHKLLYEKLPKGNKSDQ